MQEITGNLFEAVRAEAICITTNACVKKDGTNVMGAGCAKAAADLWPGINRLVAIGLAFGNTPQLLTTQNMEGGILLSTPDKTYQVPYQIVTFPTKDDWRYSSTMMLIESSARRLVELADAYLWKDVVLPRPGCGMGELVWKDVKPVLDDILDDRFYSITFPPRLGR